jgi:aspartate kinase
MGTPEAMRQSARIIAARPDARVIVVSATSGSTNALLALCELKMGGKAAQAAEGILGLHARHFAHAEALGCDAGELEKLEGLFQELTAVVSTISKSDAALLDHVLSFGERMSALLFARALRAEKVSAEALDARAYLRTDSYFGKADPDLVETKRLCEKLHGKLFERKETVVLEGFIGSDAAGRTTTLGRGGSDYSAALFAEALGASEVEIWTDVAGILTMDPRVVPTARAITEVSFAEAAEMASFGAKILHPATLWPAVRAKIPVFVGSTFAPEKSGTRILPASDAATPLIRAVAVRNHQTLITVSSLSMLNAYGFLAKLFEVLARHRISVDLVTTSEVSIALTIDGTALGSSGKGISERTEFFAELRSFAEVKIEEGLSLIAVIGNALNHSPGIAARVFQSITEFNVRLICHGASEHNICFLVAAAQANEVAKRLHHVCIETD